MSDLPHPEPASTPGVAPAAAPLPGLLAAALEAELIAFRRDLHMHPELGNQEVRTTRVLKERLERAGLSPRVLDSGTGLVCDIIPSADPASDDPAAAPSSTAPAGTRPASTAPATATPTPFLALRADIDALPIPDTKTVPYRSTIAGRCHACGHDVHTTVVLGAGLVLAELAATGRLARPVRLIFQPAEEVLPGGANDAIDSGVLEGVGRILALHCDPKVEVGRLGVRTGAITSACDRIEISLAGPGGHTARPQLTTDLVTAAAKVATEVPALLSRRVDTRVGMAVTWGRITAGHAPNVIPQTAELSGTMRCLDLAAWRTAPDLVHAAVDEVAAMYRAKSELQYIRGVPPVVNDAESTALLTRAMTLRCGAESVEQTEQSLGGEDFSWYLEHVPGAMARLGVRPPADASPTPRDIHQGDFDVDERAIRVGVELLTAAAVLG